MYEIFMQLLQENNTTTYRVAKETGISQATFSDWKRGRCTPKIDKLQKIADYFDVDLHYLLGISPFRNAKKEMEKRHTKEEIAEAEEFLRNPYFNAVAGVFEKRFAECMIKSKLTIHQIAKQLLTTEDNIENLISEKEYSISPLQILAAADIFGVEPAWLRGTDTLDKKSGTLIIKDEKLYSALKDVDGLSSEDISRITDYINVIKERYKK